MACWSNSLDLSALQCWNSFAEWSSWFSSNHEVKLHSSHDHYWQSQNGTYPPTSSKLLELQFYLAFDIHIRILQDRTICDAYIDDQTVKIWLIRHLRTHGQLAWPSKVDHNPCRSQEERYLTVNLEPDLDGWEKCSAPRHDGEFRGQSSSKFFLEWMMRWDSLSPSSIRWLHIDVCGSESACHCFHRAVPS